MTYVRRNLVPLLVAVAALAVAAASVVVITDRVRDWRGDRYEGRWGHDGQGEDHAHWMSEQHGPMQDRTHDEMYGGGAGRSNGGVPDGSMPRGDSRDESGPLLGVTVEIVKDGVRIASVQAGSAAAGAGVQVGDVLTQVDTRTVRSAADVRAALAAAESGSVRLTVQRGGKTQQLTANIGGGTAPSPQSGARRGMPGMPSMPAPGQPAQPMQPGQQPFGGFTFGPEMQQVLQQVVQRLLQFLLEAFRSGSLGGQGSGGGLFGLMPTPGGRSAPALPALPATPGTAAPGTIAYWGTVRALDARSITLDGALGPVTLQITPQTVVAGAVAPHVGGTATVVAAGSVAQTIAVID